MEPRSVNANECSRSPTADHQTEQLVSIKKFGGFATLNQLQRVFDMGPFCNREEYALRVRRTVMNMNMYLLFFDLFFTIHNYHIRCRPPPDGPISVP